MDPYMEAIMSQREEGAGSQPPVDKPSDKPPQQSLEEFWESIICKTPGKVSNIFPRSLYANILSSTKTAGASSVRNAAASYKEAAEACKTKVKRIVKECQRTNEKYTDPDFDLEEDFYRSRKNCLRGLETEESDEPRPASVGPGDLGSALSTLLASDILGDRRPSILLDLVSLTQTLRGAGARPERRSEPGCVHRVDWIFDDPSFTIDGFSTTDVQQGSNGDCWWIAAVATLCSMEGLMDRVCVARDAECGVYGFVFYRDGEWIHTVVDDSLYLRNKDYDADFDDYDPTGEKERKYKHRFQTGSEALYFAKCQSPNETWLPLLEKAYAKAHGDYDAIAGGNPGEAVEDMTGGVTTTIMTNKILNKQKLWKELRNEDKEFVFAASSPWLGKDSESRQGLALSHAYSVLKAVEEVGEDDKKVQLVLIRNPWGKRAWNGMGEWSGPWSDGSKEWTPYWMKKLDHHFGDDGEFWMSFKDFCRKFSVINRTRLFDQKWIVVQQWTSVNVSWVIGYLKTKFIVEVKNEGPVVVVLRQLDGRYFRGLEGQYWFDLQFVLQEEGAAHGDYIVHARSSSPWDDRSISAEINLKPGKYEVLPKITAARDTSKPQVEQVVRLAAEKNPQKLRQIGMNYDIAHAKGGFEEEERQRKERLKKKREAEKKKEQEKRRRAEELEKLREAELAIRQAEELARSGAEEDGKEGAKGDNKSKEKVDSKVEAGDAKEGAKEESKDVPKGESKDDTKEQSKEDSEETPNNEPKEKSREETKDESKVPKEESKEKSKEEANQELKAEAKEEKKAEPKQDTKPETKAQDSEDLPRDHPPGREIEEDDKEEKKLEEVKKDEPADKPAETNVEPADNPWNAVTVIGLLVYSKDHDATVTLVKPQEPEEA